MDQNNIDEINAQKREYYLKNLESFKKSGVKKVELICGIDGKCECCKDILDKQIPIEQIIELPMADCEYSICHGRYNPVIDFNVPENMPKSFWNFISNFAKKHTKIKS